MLSEKQPARELFWQDEQQVHQRELPMFSRKLVNLISYLISGTFILFMIAAFLSFAVTYPLAWLLLGPVLISVIQAFYLSRRRSRQVHAAQETQQRARELTGASHIGSAIHVAGHPLLERDQPVVLALKDYQLSFFSYDDPHPIASLPLDDIQTIHTVVYDDERVPHIDVIDSAAQAIQLSFPWNGQAATALFRRMLNPRPIDWYHALQQARLSRP